MALSATLAGCSQPEKPQIVSDNVSRADFETERSKIADLETKVDDLETKVEQLQAEQGNTADDENLPQRVRIIEANESNHGW